MSDKIQKTVEYYTIVADRHKEAGYGPEQEKVHLELAEMVATCSSYEEIQEKMKAQGLVEKPAQALMVDKLNNHANAARKNDLNELAAIYEKRKEEIKADFNASYQIGWEEEVSTELARMNNNVDVVNELAGYYLEVIMTPSKSPTTKVLHEKINACFDKLKGLSEEEALIRPYIRKHVSFNDENYERFKNCLLSIRRGDNKEETSESHDERIREIISFANTNKGKLKETSKAFQEKCSRRGVLYITPEDRNGEYTKEVFYESKN